MPEAVINKIDIQPNGQRILLKNQGMRDFPKVILYGFLLVTVFGILLTSPNLAMANGVLHGYYEPLEKTQGFRFLPSPKWQSPVEPRIIESVFRQPNSDWGAGHRGVDQFALAEIPLLAPIDAKILFSGQVFGRPVVTLAEKHGLKIEFEPACLVPPATDVASSAKALTVTALAVVGQRVVRGQPFAWFCPQSGFSHCAVPCLHWGVKTSKGGYLSPQRFTGELLSAKPKPLARF